MEKNKKNKKLYIVLLFKTFYSFIFFSGYFRLTGNFFSSVCNIVEP